MTANTISGVKEMESTGHPALDFVNTGSRLQSRYPDPAGAESSGYGPFGDRLHDYADLVTLAERTGAVTPELGRQLRSAARREPGRAETVLAGALRLRESLYGLFTTPPAHRASPAAAADLARLESAAQAASQHRALVASGDGYALVWPDDPVLERVLWPLATSALDLLLSPERARVKQCAGEDCNWLFSDASRNRSRRWCEMSQCGNRAKARRYAARHG